MYLGALKTFSHTLVPVSEPSENKGVGLLHIAIPSIKLQVKSVSFSQNIYYTLTLQELAMLSGWSKI